MIQWPQSRPAGAGAVRRERMRLCVRWQGAGGTRVVGFELIRLGGGILRHMLGVLLLAWRRVVRAAGIALVASIVVTEIAGVLATHHFPPYLLTHVVALAVGIVVAYCVGLMVLVDELLKGALDLVRMALGEAEAGMRAAAIIAEREVGDVWGWAQRLFVGRDAMRLHPRLASPNPASGRAAPVTSGPLRAAARTLGQFPMPRGTTGAPAPASPTSDSPARLRVPPRLGAMPVPAASPALALAPDETRDAIAATDEFRRTAPPSSASAYPVRADQLPRIEWAAEGLAAGAALLESALAARARHAHQAPSADHTPATTAAAEAPLAALPPLPPLPPLPQRAPADTSPPPAPVSPEPAVPQDLPQPTAAPPTVPLAPAAAPPTTPLDTSVSPRRPAPWPSSPVRTVPVITDDTDTVRAALEATAAADARETTSPALAPEDEADDARADPAAESAAVAPADTWEPPNRVVVLPASEGQTLAARAARGNSDVWPDDDEPSDAEARGLWSRIGQALVRSTTRPLRERSGGGEEAPPADQRVP